MTKLNVLNGILEQYPFLKTYIDFIPDRLSVKVFAPSLLDFEPCSHKIYSEFINVDHEFAAVWLDDNGDRVIDVEQGLCYSSSESSTKEGGETTGKALEGIVLESIGYLLIEHIGCYTKNRLERGRELTLYHIKDNKAFVQAVIEWREKSLFTDKGI